MRISRINMVNFGNTGKSFDKMTTDEKLNAIMQQIVELRVNQGVYAHQLSENQYNMSKFMDISSRKNMSVLAPDTRSYRSYINALDEAQKQYKVSTII